MGPLSRAFIIYEENEVLRIQLLDFIQIGHICKFGLKRWSPYTQSEAPYGRLRPN
jgi:hypothetical protein